MAHFLNEAQFEALTALCETLLPSLEPPDSAPPAIAEYFRMGATEVGVPAEVTKGIRDQSSPEAQAQFKQLLDLLSSAAGTGLLTGKFKKFADLPFETREKILQGWAVSRLGLLRQGYQGVKRLSNSLYFSLLNEQNRNPAWPALKYPGDQAPANPPTQPAITPLEITTETTLECDVVVVGSGAGGGVVAGMLAQNGHKVIVLEKGQYYHAGNFPQQEYHAFRTMYERAGLLTTEDLGVTVLAGSTLGGGTTINWAGAFRPPTHVLAEWSEDHGLHKLAGPEFQAALDAVAARTDVDTDESQCNPQNQALQDGSRQLGYHVDSVPRNAKNCQDCGFCQFGCVHDAKQGTLVTYLQDAAAAGADFVVGCTVERVLIEHGQAVGVQASVAQPNGESVELTVRAGAVVAAAGAIHTPALLLRSGLQNPNIGKHLWLHPTSAVHGRMPHPVESWRGVNMAVYSDEFADLDGAGYGVKLETPPSHLGLMAFGMPWRSARHYREIMATAAEQALLIILTRDRKSTGRVTIDKSGRPRLHYKLAKHDGEHLLTGIEASLRILAAAGAVEVGTLQSGLAPLDLTNNQAADLDDYVAQVWRQGAVLNKLGVMSAHQMGTARMGVERSRSVVDVHGESWEVKGLYVADASLFPTASGANPMLTIQGLAYMVAKYVQQRL